MPEWEPAFSPPPPVNAFHALLACAAGLLPFAMLGLTAVLAHTPEIQASTGIGFLGP